MILPPRMAPPGSDAPMRLPGDQEQRERRSDPGRPASGSGAAGAPVASEPSNTADRDNAAERAAAAADFCRRAEALYYDGEPAAAVGLAQRALSWPLRAPRRSIFAPGCSATAAVMAP